MIEILIHVITHTLEHGIGIVPFLFLTYLVMEYIEHKAGDKVQHAIEKTGAFGPVIGAVAGVVPQCGFSTAASNLYAGRVITLGTLMAIYLSTSDDMLPILISNKVGISAILTLLGIKVVIGMLAGLGIDFVLRLREKKQDVEQAHRHEHSHEAACEHEHSHDATHNHEHSHDAACGHEHNHNHTHIHELCEREQCHCEKGVFYSAIVHTVHITLYILAITFVLNLIIEFVGEDVLGELLLNRPVIGQLIAGVVGLIPNCASSVVITQLFLEGALSLGSMMAGLLVNAGVGVLVLFRVNHNKKENLQIVALLYAIGVVAGIILDLL